METALPEHSEAPGDYLRTVDDQSVGDSRTAAELEQQFQSRYGSHARIFRAPGRVNLIGEHTDYNDGFVMPSAIDFAVWIAIASRSDRKLVIHSTNFSQSA